MNDLLCAMLLLLLLGREKKKYSAALGRLEEMERQLGERAGHWGKKDIIASSQPSHEARGGGDLIESDVRARAPAVMHIPLPPPHLIRDRNPISLPTAPTPKVTLANFAQIIAPHTAHICSAAEDATQLKLSVARAACCRRWTSDAPLAVQ